MKMRRCAEENVDVKLESSFHFKKNKIKKNEDGQLVWLPPKGGYESWNEMR